MKNQDKAENRSAVSDWENDGGARGFDAERRPGTASVTPDRRRSQQEQIDASHQSDTRGEHRYADLHQILPEREARQDRDDLKQRLATPQRQPGANRW